MAIVIFMSGTTAQNDAFIGKKGSITYDTEKNNLRLHDGVTPGGKVIPNLDEIDDKFAQELKYKIVDVNDLEVS